MRNYLEALEAHKPKRGRKRTPDSIAKRLKKIETDIESADPMKRLQLSQEQIDLEKELQAHENKVDLDELEGEFIEAAAAYSERKGITYAAWRKVGVPAATLSAAGIARGAG